MWLLPWEHDEVFLHKCKEDRKLMVPTKQLWLLLDVIILLAGSQTSEYGSVNWTSKPQSSCPPMESGSFEQGPVCSLSSQAKLCSFSLARVSQKIQDLCFCSATGSSKIRLLMICLQPIPGDISACAMACSAPFIPAVPAEWCRQPCAGLWPSRKPAAGLPAAATSAEQTTRVFTQLLGWVLHPAELCPLPVTLLLHPELPGFYTSTSIHSVQQWW